MIYDNFAAGDVANDEFVTQNLTCKENYAIRHHNSNFETFLKPRSFHFGEFRKPTSGSRVLERTVDYFNSYSRSASAC